MGKSKPAPLGASLISKGSARPAIDLVAPPLPKADSVPLSQAKTMQRPAADAQIQIDESPESKATAIPVPPVSRSKREEAMRVVAGPSKSMTVKIDELTYKKLKIHGVDSGRSGQDIFVEALAMYFTANKL